MFGRRRGTKQAVVETADTAGQTVLDAAEAVAAYVDPLVRDEKVRQRVAAAVIAGATAQRRARQLTGVTGLARRLGGDPVLRRQLAELGLQLHEAQRRATRARRHTVRNGLLFAGGIGLALVALPRMRARVRSLGNSASSGGDVTIEDEIELNVPVATAYNQWTQFEEFPRFMEGVDEVRQLDDTLLHWAASVAGKHAEWDARITEQEPDQRISWESVDGKSTRGTVSFEEAGAARSRVRLKMSYTREGVTELVGSAVGLDNRRIRGDLERFRTLVEERQVATGDWRGEVQQGPAQGAVAGRSQRKP